MAPESQEEKFLFDFFYLDRNRIAAIAAQLFAEGHLTNLKRSQSSNAASSLEVGGGLPGVAAGKTTGLEGVSEAIEKQFDTSWAAPLDVLRELNQQGYVHTGALTSAPLGQIVLFRGSIQVLDYRMVQSMYKPIIAHEQATQKVTHANKQAIKQQNKAAEFAAEVIGHLPHLIQLRCFNDEEQLWGSLDPAGLISNPADMLFKYGPSVRGEWSTLAILDAKPDLEEDEMKLPQGIAELESGLLQMALHMKFMLGRRGSDSGVTPLAIYRRLLPTAD